jgi:hypothetical protein
MISIKSDPKSLLFNPVSIENICSGSRYIIENVTFIRIALPNAIQINVT